MDRRVSLAAVAVVVALIGVVAAVVKDDDSSSSGSAASTSIPSSGPYAPQPLQWEDCGGGFQCAVLDVPLDWADPTGPTIGLSVTRLPASGGSPLGALATNPGGPGASGNGALRANQFSDDVKEHYDLVSWDPRGVGDSAPLDCDGDEVEAFLALDPEPDDATEQTDLDAAAQAVGAACAASPGAALLPYVGTASVARDLEAIRLAYGGPMAYYGFSYGTSIGLEYLELFPGNMTHVVLDGVVDPTLTLTDLLKGQAAAFQSSLDAMFAACEESEHCPDGGAEAAYDDLAAEVEEHPLPTSEGDLGPAELTTAAVYAAYDHDTWEYFFAGLTAAEEGDATVLSVLAASYRGLGGFDAYQAVSCLDSVNPTGADGWAAFADEMAALSPRLGASIANEMLPCAFWPVPPAPVTGPVVAAGSGPVLVIGSTGDPATPLAQAEAVASTLADGHLLVREGEGHTAYGFSGCVRDAVAAFLIDGTVPAPGTRCPSDD